MNRLYIWVEKFYCVGCGNEWDKRTTSVRANVSERDSCPKCSKETTAYAVSYDKLSGKTIKIIFDCICDKNDFDFC